MTSRKTVLHQWFSNLSKRQNHRESWLKQLAGPTRSVSRAVDLEWDLRTGISEFPEFPGDVDATGLGNTL